VDKKQMEIETDVEWVREIAGHIARGDTLDEALAATVSFAVALVDCDRCFIYVRDGEELVLWVWKHLDQGGPQHNRLPLGRGYATLLVENQVPLAVSTNSQDTCEARSFDQWSTNPGETFVSVPLLARNELVGVILAAPPTSPIQPPRSQVAFHCRISAGRRYRYLALGESEF
jgi:uroporphyrinogen-III synthase